MTEPQIWAALGVLAAALVGMIAVVTQLMMRLIGTQFTSLRNELSSEISGLRTEMILRFEQVDLRFEQVDRRFEQVDRRFEEVDRRFERLEKQVDSLDRDVQAISKRVFPE